MSNPRSRKLALRRELLVQRAELQRQAMRARWQSGTAPLARAGALVERYRSWLGPAAAAGIPLVLMLARKRKVGWRIARWALSAWPMIRMARELIRR